VGTFTFADLVQHGIAIGALDPPPSGMAQYLAAQTAQQGSRDASLLELRRRDGRVIRLHPVVLPDVGRILIYSDITDLVGQTERMELLASTDALTGLANRRAFLAAADRELERCRRYHRPLALLLGDIDTFKQVNDRFGHDVGDRAIALVAATLQAGRRTSDLVARFGGEEFIGLLPETSGDVAAIVAERMRQSVEDSPLRIDDLVIPITVSIGTADAGSEGDLAALIKRADEALYVAKRTGRNRVSAAPPTKPADLPSAA